jgi:hypothetical protein
MSKGDKQRPTDKAKFDEAFDRIFAKCKDCGKPLGDIHTCSPQVKGGKDDRYTNSTNRN